MCHQPLGKSMGWDFLLKQLLSRYWKQTWSTIVHMTRFEQAPRARTGQERERAKNCLHHLIPFWFLPHISAIPANLDLTEASRSDQRTNRKINAIADDMLAYLFAAKAI
jgi:hypothetical protein